MKFEIKCQWRAIRFSPYDRGQIQSSAPFAVERVYRHRNTGEIRIYSEASLDGKTVHVNTLPPVKLKKRGRFGLLYIGKP